MKERKKPNLKSKEKNLTHKPNILSSRTPEPTDCRIEEGDCQVGEGARIDLPRLDVLPESRRHHPSTSSLPTPSTSRYFISVSVSLSLHLRLLSLLVSLSLHLSLLVSFSLHLSLSLLIFTPFLALFGVGVCEIINCLLVLVLVSFGEIQ